MRQRLLALAASLLAVGGLAGTSLGATHHRAATVCRRHHGHRICRKARPRRVRPQTTTTVVTTTSTTAAAPAPAAASAPDPTQPTTTTQTATTQTTTSSTPALPHGTEVDEKATGLQTPFYALAANETTLAAGTVHFNVYNADQDPHTFAVADSDGNQIGTAIDVPAGHPGSAVALTVTLPPGTYELFCTLPGHAAAGMQTTIVVK